MSLKIYEHLEQRSPEWYAARCGMVTASSVGALITPSTLKVASNETSRGLATSLVAERITGHVEPTYTNDDMMRGLMHEPIARDRYAQINGVKVDEIGFMVKALDSGHQIGASPDGLVGDDGGIEIKCPRAKGHIRTIASGEVPLHNIAQVQAQLFVSGREWWDFVSFCAGLPMFTKRVLPDPKWQAAIPAAIEAFEKAAAELTSEYLTNSAGLPATEPIEGYGEVVI